jgi:leader peptidase (prepilin peptidase) / N-methyltransferase
VLGAVTPRIAHRFSTEPATPPRPALAGRTRPFLRGLPGRVRPSAYRTGRGSRLRRCPWRTAIAGGASFGLLAGSLDGDPALPAFLAVAAIGVPLAAVDLACLRLPDPLVAAAGGVAVLGLAGAAVALGTPQPLLRALTAGLCCLAGYVVLALLPGSRLGFGDVKLAGVLGLFLGAAVAPALLIALVAGVVISVGVIISKGMAGGRKTAIPFGPFLAIGGVAAMLVGGPILDAYTSLF